MKRMVPDGIRPHRWHQAPDPRNPVPGSSSSGGPIPPAQGSIPGPGRLQPGSTQGANRAAVMVGDGPKLEDEAARQRARLGRDGGVHRQPRLAERFRRYDQADVFLYTSIRDTASAQALEQPSWATNRRVEPLGWRRVRPPSGRRGDQGSAMPTDSSARGWAMPWPRCSSTPIATSSALRRCWPSRRTIRGT